MTWWTSYREAQSTGTLQHPNIVIVHDLGEHEGSPYLVMEFLEGEPLSERPPRRSCDSADFQLGTSKWRRCSRLRLLLFPEEPAQHAAYALHGGGDGVGHGAGDVRKEDGR
jgi:serine/threonine protein kinase